MQLNQINSDQEFIGAYLKTFYANTSVKLNLCLNGKPQSIMDLL